MSNDMGYLKLVAVLMMVGAAQAMSMRCNSGMCAKGYRCTPLKQCVLDIQCPQWSRFGKGPPATCSKPPTDPQNRPASPVEKWFTKDLFLDLFPKANLGWGPNSCWPYSYEAFAIAARYFPKFGNEASKDTPGFKPEDHYRRDLAAFFSHAIQETGENDASIYMSSLDKEAADACFYRGGFFNWFEGGPISAFLQKSAPGYEPKDGDVCNAAGKYCVNGTLWPCNTASPGEKLFKGCYFGRGAIQLSYNFNYGQFQDWLHSQKIMIDLLAEPNLLMTKMDPPLAIMASLWFYMTPQPPKPAMHDIVLGKWKASPEDIAQGYSGPAFGPTSLVINNECNGEDPEPVGGPGESRRIKAFKWFSTYFGFKLEPDALLTCKNMRVKFGDMGIPVSYQPDWSSTWKTQLCDCAPATYGGSISYFAPGYYDQSFVDMNEANRKLCVKTIYEDPKQYFMDPKTSLCLTVPLPGGASDDQ